MLGQIEFLTIDGAPRRTTDNGYEPRRIGQRRHLETLPRPSDRRSIGSEETSVSAELLLQPLEGSVLVSATGLPQLRKEPGLARGSRTISWPLDCKCCTERGGSIIRPSLRCSDPRCVRRSDAPSGLDCSHRTPPRLHRTSGRYSRCVRAVARGHALMWVERKRIPMHLDATPTRPPARPANTGCAASACSASCSASSTSSHSRYRRFERHLGSA